MFQRLRNLALIGVVLIAIAAVLRVVTTPQQTASAQANTAAQDTARVERGDVAVTVSATGSIEANQSVSLSFATTGVVKSINVQEGDHVRKGQTLATLDTTSAQDALLLAQAAVTAQEIALRALTDKPRQVDIDVYQAALSVAQAQLKEASSGTSKTTAQISALKVEIAKNALWQTELTRDANDQKKAALQNDPRTAAQAANMPTDQQNNANIQASDYDVQIAQVQADASKSSGGSASSIVSAQASVTAAQVALDNLLNGGDKDDIAQAQANLKSAQHALDSAKADLAKTSLIAPFDGVVATINLNVGETAPTSDAVVMLDTSNFYVDVPIDETDISQVEVGQSVTLTTDALPGVTIIGKVAQIAATSTLSGNVVTYTVRISIDPTDQPLRSAMSTTATIITQKADQVLRVLNRYITTNSSTGKSFVNVRQPDGTFKAVEVTLGLRNGAHTEIKSGLSEGDVITSGSGTQTSGSTTTSGGAGGPGGIGIPLGGAGGPPPR
jgi:multidrug efflux pump subunit AcrA (membrane-fusion protein)